MFGQSIRGCCDPQRMGDIPEDCHGMDIEIALTLRAQVTFQVQSQQLILHQVRPNNPSATTYKMTRCDKIANVSLGESRSRKTKCNNLTVQGGGREMKDRINVKSLGYGSQAIHTLYIHHTEVIKRTAFY